MCHPGNGHGSNVLGQSGLHLALRLATVKHTVASKCSQKENARVTPRLVNAALFFNGMGRKGWPKRGVVKFRRGNGQGSAVGGLTGYCSGNQGGSGVPKAKGVE